MDWGRYKGFGHVDVVCLVCGLGKEQLWYILVLLS